MLYLHSVTCMWTDDRGSYFLRLALQLHPDKNKHPKAEIAFKLISEVRFVDSHVLLNLGTLIMQIWLFFEMAHFLISSQCNNRIALEALSHFYHYSNLYCFSTLFLYWYYNWCSKIKTLLLNEKRVALNIQILSYYIRLTIENCGLFLLRF